MKNFPSLLIAVITLTFVAETYSQTPPLSFYPYRAGNVWQYRDGFNNEVIYTKYVDRDSVGSDGAIYIRGRRVPATTFSEMIDTSFSLYNLLFHATYPRYRLNADTGQSWQAGWLNNDTVRVTLTSIVLSRVFGVTTPVKRFSFEIVPPPPRLQYSLGSDYLASGFGLVASQIEGGSSVYLAGAVIDSIRWGILVSVEENKSTPEGVKLSQNYPNPFNPITTINFNVPERERVHLAVFDILGREVEVLVDCERERGSYSVVFNAQGIASGVYFYRLEASSRTLTKKMIVQK